jgi:hypothetical protein
MAVDNWNEEEACVTLSYDDVYLLLQCCMEVWDRLDEDDARTITGSSRAEIRALADRLNELKSKMRP